MVDLSKLSDKELDALIKSTEREESIFSMSESQMKNDPKLQEKPSLGQVLSGVGDATLNESPALTGAGIGAAAGSGVGPLGAILGALGGGTAGKLIQLLVEQGLLSADVLKQGENVSGEPLTKMNPQDIALESGRSGIEMGVGEIAGQALIAPFTKMSRGFSKDVTPAGRETLEFFKGTDITPNPAKVTNSRILDLMSNAGEASIFGGEKFLQGQIKATNYIDDTIENLVQLSSHSKEALGDLFADAIKENSVAFKEAGKTLFKRLSLSVGDDFVNTAGIRQKSQGLINELSGLNVEPTLIQKLQAAGSTGVRGSGMLETGLRFSEAQALRSDLLAVLRKSSDVISDKAIGRIKSVTAILEKSMEKVARDAGPAVLHQWRRANNFWKDGINTFNSKIVKSIVDKDPDLAVNSLFTATKDRAVQIRRLKRALGNKEAIDEFQSNTLAAIIFRSKNAEGNIMANSLLNQLKNFGGTDGQALKVMFPHGEDKVLAKLARIKDVTLKAQPDSTGRFAVQIGQITAATALATGNFPKTGLSILIAPDMIARAFRNPAIVRFLTEGAKARPGTKAATTFTTRLAALLTSKGIDFETREGGVDLSPTLENAARLKEMTEQQFKKAINP